MWNSKFGMSYEGVHIIDCFFCHIHFWKRGKEGDFRRASNLP